LKNQNALNKRHQKMEAAGLRAYKLKMPY